jgi:hypothetical protein
MPARITLDDNKIVELYNSGLTSIEISEIFKVSKPTILKRLRENDVIMRPNAWEKKYKFNEDFFSEYTTENCYWAGFIAADGWIGRTGSIGIEINRIDEKHLIKFCNIIKRDPILHYRDKIQESGNVSHLCSLNLRSETIINNLKNKFYIVPAKSLILKPPINIPFEFQKHFVRGFFDGDGCITASYAKKKKHYNTRFCITAGSYYILDWIKYVMQKQILNIGNPSITKDKRKKNTYGITFGGNKQVPLIMSWLYENCENNYLDRKFKKYNDIKNIIGGI